jgi:hypothetical protein
MTLAFEQLPATPPLAQILPPPSFSGRTGDSHRPRFVKAGTGDFHKGRGENGLKH